MPEKFKDRLHHQTPAWVPAGSTFHVRVRCACKPLDRDSLVAPMLASSLLESARFYHTRCRWCCFLFLLMPDHLHALLAFPREEAMSAVIHDWKGWHARTHGRDWQNGYFDHRIRSDREFDLKANYIRENPVVQRLCASAQEWPWVCEPLAEEVGGHICVSAFPNSNSQHKHAGTGTCPPTANL